MVKMDKCACCGEQIAGDHPYEIRILVPDRFPGMERDVLWFACSKECARNVFLIKWLELLGKVSSTDLPQAVASLLVEKEKHTG
jgi:hypothetical protein